MTTRRLLLPVLLCWGCASGSSGVDGPERPGAAGASASAGRGDDAFANADGPAMLAGTGPAADGEPAELHGCNELRVDFAPVIPSVLLLVDRSGSMFDSAYAGSPTRWEALELALMEEDTGVVARFQDEVRFGLMTYTSDGQAGTCPILSSVEPALDNHGAMRALYDQESVRPGFKAETPTGAAVRAATQLLQGLPGDDPRHLLLITDGEPDTCATPDPQCGQNESVEAVQAARSLGIGTSIIGISSDVTAQHLRDLANAGSGLPVQAPPMQYTYDCVNPGYATLGADYATSSETPGDAPIYQPDDRAGLEAALETLVRGVVGCRFELQGEVDLDSAELGAVLLDGDPLRYGDSDGWHMLDSRVLELTGSACTRIQTDSERLLVSFPCDVVELL